MKGRITHSLSWCAFAHAALIVYWIATGIIADITPQLKIWIHPYQVPVSNILHSLFGNSDVLTFLFSPAVWFVNYIIIGSPRYLPWVKPPRDDDD